MNCCSGVVIRSDSFTGDFLEDVVNVDGISASDIDEPSESKDVLTLSWFVNVLFSLLKKETAVIGEVTWVVDDDDDVDMLGIC
jgi:hypothetical protein